jgi:hypothetical protein
MTAEPEDILSPEVMADNPFGFTRGSFGAKNRVHPESRCNQCGFKIVGKLDSFDHQEREHARNCAGSTTE